uniref:Nucleoside phosphorylase domain-containing protein n=1 Tax=Acrobeloides nanus TaxID=290746 RepID=A0A914E6T1_9BILA
MKNYAEQYHKETSVGLSENLSKTDRFVMYKTGPVLWVNHGMGIPSLSICLQECIKLMYYAETTDVTFMRLGTSGGLGVEPGTVVISTGAINEFLKPEYIQAVLGKKVKHDAILDKALSDELYECRRFVNTPVEKGITMGTDCFFEGQARLDGPFCDYSSEDATAFLRKLYELGVRNVEMECNCFAAITYRAGIRSTVL